MDLMQASEDTGLPDETFVRDYEGRQVSAEEFEQLEIITGEENDDADKN